MCLKQHRQQYKITTNHTKMRPQVENIPQSENIIYSEAEPKIKDEC